MRFKLAIFLMISYVQIYGQSNSAIWCFGEKAGVDFRSINPTSLGTSALSSEEGSASVCDNKGNLLFYTNGVRIWNRNHRLMLNGDSLHGHVSSRQSALIVKKPLSDSVYYVFTSGVAGNNDVVSYSTVNIKRDNGLGEVFIKNQKLFDYSAEVLTGTRHANGQDMWVVSRNREEKGTYAYLISDSGINEKAVISDVSDEGYLFGRSLFTADGKFLISSCINAAGKKGIVIWKFDKIKGRLFDAKFVESENTIVDFAFSFDDKYLFTIEAHRNTSGSVSSSGIFRYAFEKILKSSDLFATVLDTLVADKPLLTALRLANNKNIYVLGLGNLSYLSVIEKSPNADSIYSFVPDAFKLSTGTGIRGLPNYILDSSIFVEPDMSFDNSCLRDSISFSIKNITMDSVVWDMGDGKKRTTNDTFKHKFEKEGVHIVHAFVYSGQYTYTLSKSVVINHVEKPNLGEDTLMCNDGIFKLTLITSDNPDISWHDGTSGPTYTVNKEEVVVVTVRKNGCFASDTLKVFQINCGFQVDSICLGSVSHFTTKSPKADSVIWDLGDGTRHKKSPLEVFSHVYAASGSHKGSLHLWRKGMSIQVQFDVVVFNSFDEISTLEPTCIGDVVLPVGLPTNWDYQWDNLPENTPLTVEYPGEFHIKVYSNKCSLSDTFNFNPSFCACPKYFPSAFSPNNDGINDVYTPVFVCPYDIISFTIFNRWGERIYYTQGDSRYFVGWDGNYLNQVCQTGYYFWMIETKSVDNGTVESDSGILHLLR